MRTVIAAMVVWQALGYDSQGTKLTTVYDDGRIAVERVTPNVVENPADALFCTSEGLCRRLPGAREH